MNRKRIGMTAVIFLGITLAAHLWPAGDPLAGAEVVAISPSEAGFPDEIPARSVLIQGLTLILTERRITVVEQPEEADLLLEISEVRLEELELRLDEEGLRGRLSATCRLTDLRSGETHRLRLRVTLEDGLLRAELVAKRPWQFWR